MKITKDWLKGFIDGEGCFYVGILKNKSMSEGVQVQLEFTIVQHKKDIKLLYAIRKYFGCGIVSSNRGKESEVWMYRVRKYESLGKVIIPFFVKNELLTGKKFDFNKFREVYMLMEKKEHLTKEGLLKIRKLKEGMNKRILDKEIVPTLLRNKE